MQRFALLVVQRLDASRFHIKVAQFRLKLRKDLFGQVGVLFFVHGLSMINYQIRKDGILLVGQSYENSYP